jgi:hypothetical protein
MVAATGRPLVVAAVVASSGRLHLVAFLVAATGRLPMVVPLAGVGPVARDVVEAINRACGMPPRLPLRKRGVLAVRLDPERMLAQGGLDLPALGVQPGQLGRGRRRWGPGSR